MSSYRAASGARRWAAGFLPALLSLGMNNMPAVLIGPLSVDASSATGVVKEAMIYAPGALMSLRSSA